MEALGVAERAQSEPRGQRDGKRWLVSETKFVRESDAACYLRRAGTGVRRRLMCTENILKGASDHNLHLGVLLHPARPRFSSRFLGPNETHRLD